MLELVVGQTPAGAGEQCEDPAARPRRAVAGSASGAASTRPPVHVSVELVGVKRVVRRRRVLRRRWQKSYAAIEATHDKRRMR